MIKIYLQISTIFFLLFFLSRIGIAQNVIYGQVTDSETGQAISFANVFIENSNKGTATDDKGNYRLENVPRGIHKVVFSHIGYSSRIILVESLIYGATDTVNVALTTRTLNLEELTVMDSRPVLWNRQASEFELTFIGSKRTQKDCEIINREVLLFRYADEDESILQAFSDEPLLIENRYLGYRLSVILHEYEWDVSKNIGKYIISAQFDTLGWDSNWEKKSWVRNRKAVYFGSERHFFSLLYEEAGWGEFRVYDGQFVKLEDAQISELTSGDQFVQNLDMKMFKGFHVDRKVTVVYGSHASYLLPNKPYIFVDEYGNIFDPTSLTIAGEWATHRVSEMLPRDYFPK